MVKKLVKIRLCGICGETFSLAFAGHECPRCKATLMFKNAYVEEGEEDERSPASPRFSARLIGFLKTALIVGFIVALAVGLFAGLLIGILRFME
ncbi:MAG: hypothetical protein ABIJ27_07345 [Candidatus Omnitrophota bacterium]